MLKFEMNTVVFLLLGGVILIIAFYLIFFLLKKIGKDPHTILPVSFAKRIRTPLVIFLVSLLLQAAILGQIFRFETSYLVASRISVLGFIFSITWFLISILRIFKNRLLRRYNMQIADNLRARKVYTQFMILENIIIFIIVVLALGIALMTFESIRSVGVSLLTSAGIAGIIIGFAAQKTIGTLLAGIQLALTQPIRLDDVVIIDGEWGRIEEITLTYVVVKIWDQRRLVIPTTYFIENTFQNWTRTTSQILGTVFIYTDYDVPVDQLREELTRLLEGTPLWDKRVNVLQVTDATERSVELRALMSAADSGTAWDLRVYIREKLLLYLKEHFPGSLPKSRVSLEKNPLEHTD